MNSEREQALRDILEKTAADLKALSLAVDTICLGLERESTQAMEGAESNLQKSPEIEPHS